MNDIVVLDEDYQSNDRTDRCDDPFSTQMLSAVRLLVERMDVMERKLQSLDRKQRLDLLRSSPYSHRSQSNLFSFFV